MARPTMTPVKSSNIKAVGHDPATSTLYVEFSNGGTYAYEEVAQGLHADLLASTSAGSFIHAHVKGRFKSRKLEADE